MPIDYRLRNAEREVRALLPKVDVALSDSEEQRFVVSLALRATELYRGVLHACSGPSLTSAEVVLRSLLDLVVLMRWIEASPGLHVAMWIAEDDRTRVFVADQWREMTARRGRSGPPAFSEEERAAIAASVQKTRAEALTAGEPIRKTGAVLPSTEVMSKITSDLFEVYQVAYRTLSPSTHTAPRSLVNLRIIRRADGNHMRLAAGFDAEQIRSLAVPAICFAIASAARVIGLPQLAAAADNVRIPFATWDDPG